MNKNDITYREEENNKDHALICMNESSSNYETKKYELGICIYVRIW